MAKNNNLNDFLKDLADGIRDKKGTTALINAQNFRSEIASIETGITPTGSIDITSNGTVDVTNYASANVNVPSSGENTLKNLLDETQSARYLFYGYQQLSVDDLIQYDDTDYVKNMNNMFAVSSIDHAPQLSTRIAENMSYMFSNCTNLTTIPQYATRYVTNMDNMFSSCEKLTEIPRLDTREVTTMFSMFNLCKVLTTIPLLNTSNVTNMAYMFNGCGALTSIPQLDTSKVTSMSGMFSSCASLTTIPQLDTREVTSMYSIFSNCTNLTAVPAIDVRKVTNMDYMFRNCAKLKSILMTYIGANLDISASKQFEHADLVTILNNLATVTSSKTLTMGETNLAKLTDEDKAIATNKGWTLA